MENNEPLKKSRKGLLTGIIISAAAALALIITTVVIIAVNSNGKGNTNKKPAVDLNLPDDISKADPDEAFFLSLKKLAHESSSQVLPSNNYIEAVASVKIDRLGDGLIDEIVDQIGINPVGLSLSVDFINTKDNCSAVGIRVGKDNSDLAGIEIFRTGDNLIIGAPGIINGYYSVNLNTIAQDIKGSVFEDLLRQSGIDFDDFDSYFSQFGSITDNMAANGSDGIAGIDFITKLQSFISDNEELFRNATVEKVGTSGDTTEYSVTYKARDIEDILNKLIEIIGSYDYSLSGLDNRIADVSVEEDLSFNVTIRNDFTITGFELRNPDNSGEYLIYEADGKGNVTFEFNADGSSFTFSKTASGKNKLTIKDNGQILAELSLDMSVKDAPSTLKMPVNTVKLFELTENDIMILTQDMTANIMSLITKLGIQMYGIR